MEDGGNVHQLADPLQAVAAELLGLLAQQAGLGGSLGGATGDHDDDVVGDELLHQLDVGGIRADLGVVAAHHGHGAPEDAGLDALHQGLHGTSDVHLGVGDAVQALLDGLHGVAHGGVLLQVGDMYQILVAVLEVLHGQLHNGLGVLPGVLGVELNEVAVGHPGDGGGGDELGVEALAEGAQSGEDALHVHHDGLAGAGEDHVLLLEEVAGHGDAVAHGHLVGGAAHAADVDALGALLLGQSDHLGVLGIENDHLRERGVVAVNHDVDHVLLHDAQVGGGVHRLGGAEEHVGELGAAHGPAPAVGQAGPEGLADQGLGEGGAAHVGHVQGLGDLTVDGPGLDAGVVPELPGVLGGPAEPALGAEGLAVLHQGHLGDLVGQVVDVLTLGLHAPLTGDALELGGILHGVVAALSGLIQSVADLTAVVRVGGGAAGGEAQVVAGHDAVYVTAADAPGRLGGDAAGTHGADAAADALLAEFAVGGLVLHPLLPGISAYLTAGFQQPFGGGFHLLDSDQFHSRNVENTVRVSISPFSRDHELCSVLYCHTFHNTSCSV